MTDLITSLEKPKQNRTRRSSNSLNQELFKWYGWGTPLGWSILILSSAAALCALILVTRFAFKYL